MNSPHKSLLNRLANGVGWSLVLLWAFEFLFSTTFGLFLVMSMLYWVFIGLLGGAIVNSMVELPVSGEPWFLILSGVIALVCGAITAWIESRKKSRPVPPSDDD